MNYETMYSDWVDQPGLPFCELTFHQRQLSEAFGGGMAGAVLPLIMTPVELIKVQRQILQRQSNNWAVAKDIHGARGIRGLYTGHSLTTTRAILGNTLLFGTYGLWKKGVVLRLERKVCKVWAPRFLGQFWKCSRGNVLSTAVSARNCWGSYLRMGCTSRCMTS